MSRIVWVNASAGVAGDMLLGALVDAGADRLAIMAAWGALGLDGYAATWESVSRAGVTSLWTNIAIDERDQHDGHDDSDHHHPEPDHSHRRAADVIELIERSELSARVRADAVATYRALAEVEGAIHGVDPADVELHEVGALDSILDVVGVCAALDDLAIDEVVFSPIGVGHGTVTTQHGVLPNPVPAVLSLSSRANATLVGVDTPMELATPTGVALLTVLGRCGPMPTITVRSQGFGAGTADPPGRANVVAVTVGESGEPASESEGRPGAGSASASDDALVVDRLVELTTNVDDTTGEMIAYTIDRLLAAGALDAWAVPIIMKKGRPAHTVHVLVNDDRRQVSDCRELLLRELGTLGVRTAMIERARCDRDEVTVSVDGHQIRVKRGPWRSKAEYDDVAHAAAVTGRAYRVIANAAENAAADS